MNSRDHIMQLCRLCLIKEGVNTPIFGEVSDTFHKIISCLPVKVTQEDHLPKSICETCAYKLDMFYLFRSSSMDSETQLHIWLADDVNHTVPDNNYCDDLMQGVKQEAFETTPEVRIGDEELNLGTNSVVQYEPGGPQNLKTARKRLSQRKFDSSSLSGVKIDDYELGDDDPGPESDDESDLDYNPGKGQEAGPSGVGEGDKTKKSLKSPPPTPKKTKRKRRRHGDGETNDEAAASSTAVRCDLCDRSYANNVAFGLHSITHTSDNKYSCHLCDYRNASKYHIEQHIRAHEGTTRYKCEVCNKAFTVSTHAIEHKYFHTGEKPFQCEICGKHFMFSWFLTSHRRTQHWEIMTGTPLVKYDCVKCEKHYTSATGLRRHNLSKHNDSGIDFSVLCDICGKQLSSKEKLKFHRRTHTGYRPFGCEICGKCFSRKEQLREHERVHTGEKPFICAFCGKGFTQRSPLRIHERTHTGERPYVCRLCGKGYISKGVMDTHMKSCVATLHSF